MRHAGVTKLIDPRGMSQTEYQARRSVEEFGAESQAEFEVSKALGTPLNTLQDKQYKAAISKLAAAYDAPHASSVAREKAITDALAEVREAGLIAADGSRTDLPLITDVDLVNYNRDYDAAQRLNPTEPLTQVAANATASIKDQAYDLLLADTIDINQVEILLNDKEALLRDPEGMESIVHDIENSYPESGINLTEINARLEHLKKN